MAIGGNIIVGAGRTDDGPPAADIRSFYQWTHSDNEPEGYTGVRDDSDALLGGSLEFVADEVEVLSVVQ
ncbi:unnamed protein product [Vitrella brassicaformis CCMP3155]|uniref:Uncharacterized protein n=1 Tax=Vitrella brassicaformis (strain CCMP3155) TaxID=1169540 RepID=A0A0G4GDJ1_VITBC|nr:unnamed protein product [Vitrella brassicaformis CCMP3155]|eukprot:CEM27066.1 unnamed protein product [Vitrella brassicaformis CCMP3155]